TKRGRQPVADRPATGKGETTRPRREWYRLTREQHRLHSGLTVRDKLPRMREAAPSDSTSLSANPASGAAQLPLREESSAPVYAARQNISSPTGRVPRA